MVKLTNLSTQQISIPYLQADGLFTEHVKGRLFSQ